MSEAWDAPSSLNSSRYSTRYFSGGITRGSRDYRAYDHVRKSIFGGVAVCAKCGHALCSCGTVYKGEREKYWYLSCTHQRQDIQPGGLLLQVGHHAAQAVVVQLAHCVVGVQLGDNLVNGNNSCLRTDNSEKCSVEKPA